MPGGALLLIGAAALLPDAGVTFRAQAHIETQVARLGDVANLAALPEPLRARASALALVEFRKGQKLVHVSQAQMASRARSLMPALRFWLAGDPAGEAVISRGTARREDVAIAPPPQGRVAKGEAVTFHVRAGIFDIAREGVAVQDAELGEHLFVRTGDNRIVSACLCEGEAK